jgi:predicted transcriptional regulator of viral defense system
MQKEKIYNYIEQYINSIQANGKLSFSLEELRKAFNTNSLNALKLSLNRLSKKEKIVSVYKGFYIIIPTEYQQKKILPSELFLDSLFKYLERPYYLGLLSAAAIHGASHQQAMESYVFINKPPIRPTNVKGIRINYVVKSRIPEFGLEKRKTAAGYINISGPELTALDLVEYQQRVGGLNRVSTVLYELSESIQPDKLVDVLKNSISLSTIQRLGYILNIILDKPEISSVLKNYLSDKRIFRVPLKSGLKKNGFPVSPEWKIIENHKIVTDF